MDTFMVTGGSGFIGSALCDYLLNKYKDVRVINVSKQTYATNLDYQVPRRVWRTLHIQSIRLQRHITSL